MAISTPAQNPRGLASKTFIMMVLESGVFVTSFEIVDWCDS
ncbi:MAG: hypothetical protein ACK50J_29070 [Planctomyces sp.]|jgi:hypothetical protein